MNESTQTSTEAIRALNDALRQGNDPNGRVMVTQGILTAGEAFVKDVIQAVQTFDGFGPDNDPYGEHDFGAFTVAGRKIYFKIDYFDRALASGSSNPADPLVTMRLLTIMLAEEY